MIIKQKLVLLVIIFVSHISLVLAAIQNLQCTISNPTDFTKKYNSGQEITISATWDTTPGIATPPFAANFNANGRVIGSVNSSTGAAQFSVSASTLSESANTFGVEVIETSVPNARPESKTAGQSVTIDKTPPGLTLTITSGQIVSPKTGFNIVTLQFVSNENLAAAPTFKITPGTWSSPSPITPANPPFTVIMYQLTVPADTPDGAYTITVEAEDNTEPAATRNKGTAQVSFTVDARADGAPTIQSSSPQSPVRVEYVVLSGIVPVESGGQRVEVLEGGTVVGSTNVGAGQGNWSANIGPLSEGTHKYTARRVDPLGNVSTTGNEFTVIADRTSPGLPVLDRQEKPVNTPVVQITGSGSTDLPHNSYPVKVYLYREGTRIAQTNANPDGSFTFTNVTLVPGTNLLFAQAADTTWDNSGNSGNQTGFSAPVTYILDQSAPQVIPGGVVISSSRNSISYFVDSSTNGNSDRFIPPLVNYENSTVDIILPSKVIHDRYPNSVEVEIILRQLDSNVTATSLMNKQGENFIFSVVAPKSGLGYRFLTFDRAGNKAFFPETGELMIPGKRCELLRLTNKARRFCEEDAGADEWPMDLLGFPPRERLLAYRRVLVPHEKISEIRQVFIELGIIDQVEIGVIGEYNSSLDYKRDLELLNNGRFPVERSDLLLHEIVTEKIPLSDLPTPSLLPESPEFRQLQDAIQFRFLHELIQR